MCFRREDIQMSKEEKNKSNKKNTTNKNNKKDEKVYRLFRLFLYFYATRRKEKRKVYISLRKTVHFPLNTSNYSNSNTDEALYSCSMVGFT